MKSIWVWWEPIKCYSNLIVTLPDRLVCLALLRTTDVGSATAENKQLPAVETSSHMSGLMLESYMISDASPWFETPISLRIHRLGLLAAWGVDLIVTVRGDWSYWCTAKLTFTLSLRNVDSSSLEISGNPSPGSCSIWCPILLAC